MPAGEVLKAEPDGTAHNHNFFLVPKHCNICNSSEHWRKSNCMAEMAFIVNEMSHKHRKCYQIMKYCLSNNEIHGTGINWYHLKTVVLNHSRECLDTSEESAECVLKVLTDLKRAYESKKLISFHDSDVNLYRRKYKDCGNVIQEAIKRICSVEHTDTPGPFLLQTYLFRRTY